MKLTITVLAVVFILYTLWIALQFGIKKSISESYYVLERSGHGYFFTFFMWFITGCLISVIVQLGPDRQGAWAFFVAASGAGFVGTATMYLKKMSSIVHFVGALVLIFFSLIGIGLVFDSWYPFSFMGTVMVLSFAFGNKIKIPNVIYWIEVLSFIVIIVGLYIAVL